MRRPGASGFTALPDTTLFDIESGRIGNGQFTATLKGDDSDENASADQTVLGYEGDILGEFYGPAAEEVGGVLNAVPVSDKHNSVLSGWFGGRQLGSVVPEGASSPPSSVGVERDIVASTVQAADDSGVTAISSDGESGYNVTYTIDGVEHAVHLLGSDYGANPRYFTSYERDTGTQRYSLYSPLDSFFGTSEYDHFDVAGWVTVRDSDDGSWRFRIRHPRFPGPRSPDRDRQPACWRGQLCRTDGGWHMEVRRSRSQQSDLRQG